MPNIIDQNGIQIKEIMELVSDLNSKLEIIYGSDINLDPETPDGQFVTIFSQAIRDIEELILGVGSSFDPDQAEGVILDQRVAINGIQRNKGSNTITNVDVTTSKSVNLYGLDHSGPEQKFIVEDSIGNQWILRNTANILQQDTVTLSFQSVEEGQILSTPNTITTPVTIVDGVVSVNNPYEATTIGIGEETDEDLKRRRRQSVSLSSQGFLDGLLAELRNLTGMIDAYVYENRTSADPDSRGIPSHSIWVVTDGTSSDEDIANAIYRKRNAGAGIKEGAKSYTITQVDGTPLTVYWDEVNVANLFVRFDVTPLDPNKPVSIQVIKDNLPTIFKSGVGGQVNINDLACDVQSIDNNALVTNAGFSKNIGGPWANTLSPNLNEKFSLIKDNIIITPIQILPDVATVIKDAVITFVAVGGYAPFTWTILSGTGTIDSNTGEFSSGATGPVKIKVEDALGNYTEKDITVVNG